MAGEITSRFAIDVTVERLKQIQDLHTSIEQILKLTKGKTATITLDLDTKEFDRKFEAANKKAKGFTVTPAIGGGAGGGGTAHQDTKPIKLDLGKVETTMRGIQTTLTAVLNAIRTKQKDKAQTIKLDSGTFDKSVTRFSNSVERMASAAADIRAAATALRKLPAFTGAKGAIGRQAQGITSVGPSGDPQEERALRAMVRRRFIEEQDFQRQEKAAAARKQFLDKQRNIAIQMQEREAYDIQSKKTRQVQEAHTEAQRTKTRDTRAMVQERIREDKESRRAARREPYIEARANTRIDVEQAARAASGQYGFAGFVGGNLEQKARAFVQVLNRSLTGLTGSIANYNNKVQRLEEAATPTQTTAALRQLGRQGLDVRARQSEVASLVNVAAQQGLPGAEQFQDLLGRYSAAREDKLRQQSALFRVNRAEDLSRDTEMSPERRAKFADKAARLKAAAQAQGINNQTLKEAITLEEGLARVLNLSANAFAKQANATFKSRDALQHFNDRLVSLARFAGAGALLFTVTSTLTNAFSQTVKLEAAFRRIQGILPGRSLTDRLKIEEGTLKAAQDFAANIEDAVKNAQLFAQTGIGPEATIQETRSALAAARGGGIDQGQAVETAIATRAVSAVQGINQSLSSSLDIFNRIARIEATTAATGQDLAISVQRLGALVKATQPTPLGTVDAFDTLLGNVAEIVTTTRVTGSQAQTALKFIISRLSAPDVSKALQGRFGIKLADETGKGARPLSDILSDISDEFKRLRATGQTRKAQELLVTVAGGRQLGIATALFENFNRSLAFAQESSLAMGDIQARTALQMDTLEARTTQLNNAFTIFFKNLLEQSGILRGLTKVADVGSSALERGSKNPVVATVGTAVVLAVLDQILSSASGKLSRNVEARRLTVAAKTSQKEAIESTGFGAAAGVGATVGSQVALRGLSKLSLLLRGITGITGLWPVLAFIGGISALGAVLYKLSRSKDQFEGLEFNFKPPVQKDVQETIGADLQRFARGLNTSPTGIISGIDTATQATVKRLEKTFPNLQDLLTFDKEGKPKATDTRFFKEFTKAFTEELSNTIPGLQAITDETDRTATAMRLLRSSIQFGSIQGELNQSEVLVKTKDFIDSLRTRLLPAVTALPLGRKEFEDITASTAVKVSPGLAALPRGTGSDVLSRDAAERIGLSYSKDFILYQEQRNKVNLLNRGNSLTSNDLPKVQGQIRSVIGALLPQFQDTFKNLKGLKDSSGNVVDAFQFLATTINKNGGTLGQALDEFATKFLSIQSNRDIFKAGILEDLRKIPAKGSEAAFAPSNAAQVGGETFLNTFFDLISESATQLAKEYRARGESVRAIQQEALARAANLKESRGKALAEIQGNARQGFVRDRLIEILGQFAIREQGIRFAERTAPVTGRGFDAAQERLRSIEQLTDALGTVGAQTRLDLVRINSRINQAAQFTTENLSSILLRSTAEETDTGRTSAVDFLPNSAADANLPISDELKSLKIQQSTLQAAVLSLAPDSLEEVLRVAKNDKQGGQDKQFLLESLFKEVRTVQDARNLVVSMNLLTRASIQEEKARREIIVQLEREAEVLRQSAELRLTTIRQSQALAQIGREGRIREAEVGGTVIPFGAESQTGLLRPSERGVRVRGSLASVGLRAADIAARVREAEQLAKQSRTDAEENIALRRSRGAGTQELEDLIRKADFDYKKAVLDANNEAAQNMARLLQEERLSILADTQAAIRTAADSGTQGLRDVLSSFEALTEGDLVGRLLGPASKTLTEGFSNLLADNLVGAQGIFAKQVEALFGQPANLQRAQQEATLQAQILSSSELRAFTTGGDYVHDRIVDALGSFLPATYEQPGPPTAQETAQVAAGALLSDRANQVPGLAGFVAGTAIPAILGGMATQNGIASTRGNLVAGSGGNTTLGYYGNTAGTFTTDLASTLSSTQNLTGAARTKAIKAGIAGLIGAYGGAAIGGAIGGKGVKGSYAGEGASLGSGVGGLIGGPAGSIVGGIFGGILGGLFGKKKPQVTPELAILEKIDRGIRAQTAVIENGNRALLSLDNRLLNAPANFALTGYRPLNAGGGNSSIAGTQIVQAGPTYTFYIDARGASNPEQVEARVRRAVGKGLRNEGTYLNRKF